MSRRRRVRALLAAGPLFAAFVGASPLCRADGLWSGSIAATSDYVFRGVSQTYGRFAAQGGVNYLSAAGWFAGAWASNVNPYPFGVRSTEVNVYSGFAWTLSSAWAARATYTRYLYAWDGRPGSYDYGEFSVTLGFEDRLAATISYQPDSTRYATLGFVRNRPAAAYELTGRWPLPRNFALTAGVGYYELSRLYGVRYWSGSAGASYGRGRFEFDVMLFFGEPAVRRLFEDASADGSWAATAIWRF